MISFTFKGHKISIRNDDWQNLKKRFNAENAKFTYKNDWVIDEPCSLCIKFDTHCSICPIHRSETSISCLNLIRQLCGFKHVVFLSGKNTIRWYQEDNVAARRQLKAILRRMDKIEANQQ